MNDEATAAACSRCTSLKRTLAEQHARIAELEAKLGNNSSPSSKPPSSDPPWKSSACKPRSGKNLAINPGIQARFASVSRSNASKRSAITFHSVALTAGLRWPSKTVRRRWRLPGLVELLTLPESH